jgi:hypothetical protein
LISPFHTHTCEKIVHQAPIFLKSEHGDVLDHAMALKAVTSILVVEQVISGEHVEHEIGRPFETVIRWFGIALLELAVAHHHNDARTEPRVVIQLDRRVYATVQTGREQPVVVDTHGEIGQQS